MAAASAAPVSQKRINLPQFSYWSAFGDLRKEKKKDCLKVLRDAFLALSYVWEYMGYEGAASFARANKGCANAVNLFGFISLVDEVEGATSEAFGQRRVEPLTEKVALTTVYGCTVAKVLQGWKIVNLSAATPYIGPVKNVASIVSSGITLKNSYASLPGIRDFKAEESDNEQVVEQAVLMKSAKMREKMSTIAKHIALVALSVIGLLTLGGVIPAVAATQMLAISAVAVGTGVNEFFEKKQVAHALDNLNTLNADHEWKQLKSL